MKASRYPATGTLGIKKGISHLRQAAASDRRADQSTSWPQGMTKDECGDSRIFRLLESSNGNDYIGKSRFECFQGQLIDGLRIGNARQSVSTGRVVDNRNPTERTSHLQTVQTIFESAFVQKPVPPLPCETALLGQKAAAVELGHGRACAEANPTQQEVMNGIFRMAGHGARLADVLTSGNTSEACARALLKAGARQVDLLCFARVVRPSLLTR